MFLRIFLLLLIVKMARSDNIFESLYKSEERSRATACSLSRDSRACRGLLWRRTWMLARGSCLLDYPLSSIYVKKGVNNCSHEQTTIATIATGELCNRNVVGRYKHPQYPAVDLVLLRLDWPYSTEFSDNRTISENILTKLDDWMKSIVHTEATKSQSGFKNYQMYSTPVRMFLVTVVLPSASFIVFFLFIIFFTGKSKTKNIPYRNLNSDKKTTYV